MYGPGSGRLAAGAPPAASAAVALGVLTQCTVVGLARFGFGLLLPPMRAELDAGYAAMGAVATVGFVGHMAGSLLAGVVAMQRGSQRVLVVALALTGLTTIATGSATSVLDAGFWQLLAGVGGGGAIVASHGLVMGWYDARRRGIATGIVVGGSGIGLLAAGLLLPQVLTSAPEAWRTGWVVIGVPALLAALAALFIGRDAPDRRPRPEAGAAVRLGHIGEARGGGPPDEHRHGSSGAQAARPGPPGAAAETAAREAQPSNTDPGRRGLHSLRSGRTVVSPRPSLLRHPLLWGLWLVTLCWASTYIVFMTFFGAAGLASGLDAAQVGQLWMLLGTLSSGSAVVWGAVSDRVGRLPTLALVYVLQGLACAALGLAPTGTWFTAAAILFGLGGWATPALVNAAGADLAGRRLAPAVLGLLTLVFGIGQALGPLAAGLLNDATGSFATSSLAAGAVLLVGAALALAMRRIAVEPA